jgi:hypothetical protein
MLLKEQEITIIESWVVAPVSQNTENLASRSHETRRVSDPYIFTINQEKLSTPGGVVVEEIIDKYGYLGQVEARAFEKIQNWANKNTEGLSLWISPPYPNEYPVSKAVVSEIVYSSKGQKLLLNRAIVLDIEEKTCLEIANQFGVFSTVEGLRETPIFFNHQDYTWIGVLDKYTSQTKDIKTSQDIVVKNETYFRVNKIEETIYVARQQGIYLSDFEMAKKEDLIGKHQESCPSGKNTAFNVLSNEGSASQESKILRCTCPFCKAQVSAVISGGRIHCPNCGASATYSC